MKFQIHSNSFTSDLKKTTKNKSRKSLSFFSKLFDFWEAEVGIIEKSSLRFQAKKLKNFNFHLRSSFQI